MGAGESKAAAPAPDPVVTDPDEALKFTVKNLDTGEICTLDEVAQFFPETASVMTLAGFESMAAAAALSDQTKQSAGPEVKVTAEELKETRQALGFVDKVKKVFTRGPPSLRPDNAVKVKTNNVQRQELTDVKLVESLLHHTGPIWTSAWSQDGTFFATGGQDSIVRVWAVTNSPAAHEQERKGKEKEAKLREGGDSGAAPRKSSSAGSSEPSLSPPAGAEPRFADGLSGISKEEGGREILRPTPYRLYSGHKADVIDLSWSKANFLLSASIDKTVRLWHVSRQKCLCVFQHSDFVTAVAFHPVEDRYFLSGSFDKKLRIWNIPEHRVVEWAQTANIITAAGFSPDGRLAVAGLYNGQCVFYQAEGLKYSTQVECRNRQGKNRKGKKVTGIQFSPDGKHLLVTTNDSRIRLFDMDDYSMASKFKGLANDELQIKASFSPDGSHIICGSENQQVYVWRTALAIPPKQLLPKKRARNDSYEYFKGNSHIITCAQFVPRTAVMLSADSREDATRVQHMIVACAYNGEIRFFENRGRPKDI